MDHAEELYKAGIKPGCSTDICGQLTIGYGELDDYGNWEFPLHVRYWPVWALAYNYA
jgi:hypothetical protein